MHKKFMLLTLLATISASQAEAPVENLRDLMKAQTQAETATGEALKKLVDQLAQNNKQIVAALTQSKPRNPRSLAVFVAGAAVGTGCTLWVNHKNIPELKAATNEYLEALKSASANFTSNLRQPARAALKDIIDNDEYSESRPVTTKPAQADNATNGPALTTLTETIQADDTTKSTEPAKAVDEANQPTA